MSTRHRWWLVVGLLLSAGLVTIVALRPPADPAAAAAARGPGSPLWSARRLPGPIVDPLNDGREHAASAALERSLDAEVAPFGSACYVVQRGAKVIASHQPDAALTPASTQKLLVAVTTLATLGPDHRFETRALARASGPVVDQLWIVGGGDPVIRTARFVDAGISTPLDALADAIVAGGVRRVGSLVGDDGRYDQLRTVPSWSGAYQENLDAGPLGALMVDQGVTFAGAEPILVEDPAIHVARELAALLRARGVEVGDVARGSAPADAVAVGATTSHPLRSILGYMLDVSDNVSAELLTKELGLRERGEGSTAAGATSMREVLGRLGVTLRAQPTVDGSGLDRGNRLSCADLVAVLGLAERAELRVLGEVLPGDRRPGGDGSVRAKSGYIADVTGLAGRVDRPAPLTFSIVVNGGVPRSARAIQHRFADVVASYSPPALLPDAVVPEPTPAR